MMERLQGVEIVKAAKEPGVVMITDPTNQIILGVIPAAWKLSIIVNCCKRKDNV